MSEEALAHSATAAQALGSDRKSKTVAGRGWQSQGHQIGFVRDLWRRLFVNDGIGADPSDRLFANVGVGPPCVISQRVGRPAGVIDALTGYYSMRRLS